MQKLIKTGFLYLLLAIVNGVFYREFTRMTGFTGKTSLAFTHLHFMVLGFVLFLILALFSTHTDILSQKYFSKFYITYNVALPFMVVMLYIRGIFQVLGTTLSTGATAAISGMAGISHMVMTVALVFLFLSMKQLKPVQNTVSVK